VRDKNVSTERSVHRRRKCRYFDKVLADEHNLQLLKHRNMQRSGWHDEGDRPDPPQCWVKKSCRQLPSVVELTGASSA
jgi:hypothetical protein